MGFDDSANDGQAEAQAVVLAGQRVVESVKLMENPPLAGGWNALAVVGDFKHRLTVAKEAVNADPGWGIGGLR